MRSLSKRHEVKLKLRIRASCSPGRMNMKTAASEPRSLMTEPMFGIDTDSRMERMNLKINSECKRLGGKQNNLFSILSYVI